MSIDPVGTAQSRLRDLKKWSRATNDDAVGVSIEGEAFAKGKVKMDVS